MNNQIISLTAIIWLFSKYIKTFTVFIEGIKLFALLFYNYWTFFYFFFVFIYWKFLKIWAIIQIL